MGAPNPRKIRNIPSRLVSGPTSLAGDYPYGGTGLGEVSEIEARLTPTYAAIRAMEYQGLPVELVAGNEVVVLGAVLREYDTEAIAALFPSTVTDVTGHTRVSSSMTTQRGALGSARAIKLLVAPLDTEGSPALLLYRAVPLVGDAARLAWGLDSPYQIAVLFQALPDATGRVYQMGFLEGLVL